MGLKKLNSEYHSRYKTFKVHRPVTTKAKISSHPIDSAPEVLESSRRAGLLSNQFTNVSEPALQRKRIVPYKHNHNILSTNTVKELNDRDWLEAVGNGEDSEIAAASIRRKDAKKLEDTEYISSFAKLKVEKDSPVILASKAKMKEKIQHRRDQARRSPAATRGRQSHLEKSPESLPPAGIPTYITDPQDKRLLRPCDDLLYPATPQDVNRNSQTEYSERYKSSTSGRTDKKTAPSSDIDLATYKKVLHQRNDAYGLSVRPSTSPAKQQSSPRSVIPKRKHRRPQSARRHSIESKQSGSHTAGSYTEGKQKEFAKTYNLPRSKHKDEKMISKQFTRIPSPRRSLDEESLSSIRSANHLEASRKSRKGVDKKCGEKKHEVFYADSVSSRNSQRNETEEKLIHVDTWMKRAKSLDSNRDMEKETISSTRSFENKTRKRSEKSQSEKHSRSRPERTWREKMDETRGSRRINRDTKRSILDNQERGRSPTPEMRTAGQSRRHHLDLTTGSNNPLATGPADHRRALGSMDYERVAYDPSRYSDVAGSLASSRSFATWSDRGS